MTLFPEGTVVFAKSGMSCMTGNVYVLPEPCYVVSHLACVIPVGDYAVYLKHYFRSNRPSKLVENPSFPSIRLSKIQNMELEIPVRSEMEKQVRSLEHIESLIEWSKEQIAMLDTLVKSRFVEMFGDPTAPGDRWPVSRLDGFTKIITGNTPPRKHAEYYGDGIEWVKTDNIVDSAITAASERLTEIGRSKARVAPTGSILMACIAGSVKSIGKVGLLDREVAFNQQINAIVPMDIADSRYLLTMFTVSKNYLCSDVNQQLKGILNKSSLSSKQFPLPPLALQQEFASFVAEVDKSRFNLLKAYGSIIALFRVLFP